MCLFIMSSRNDKYRNPPLPLGYVKKNPQLVQKKCSDVDGINIDEFINLIILSGICDVPDASVYDHFTINSCSEDDDITEVPVEICEKKIEVLHIEDEDASPELKEDSKVVIKKEVESPKRRVTSENIEQDSKASTIPQHTINLLKTDLCTGKSDKIAEDKKPKKHDRGHKSSYHSKKISERRDSYSNYDSDSSSYRKIKHVKKDYESASDSHSRRRHKRRESYDSDSDSHSRSRHRIESIDSESSRRKKLPKRYVKKEYDSDDSSRRIKPKKEYNKSYDSDDSSHKKKIKSEYSSDSSESSSVRLVRRHDYSSKLYDNDEYEDTASHIKQEADPGLLFGQYTCEVCNITLNSYSTFQSHMNGKRHLKALNSQTAAVKTPAVKPLAVVEALNSQTAAFHPLSGVTEGSRCPKPPPGYYRKRMDCPAHIQQVLDRGLRIPCPGLENVTEIHTVAETVYYCSFCDSPCGSSSILPHLNGYKHRLNILKHYRNNLYQKWNYLSKHAIEDRLMQELMSIEFETGRGYVRVEKDFRVADSNIDEFGASSRKNQSKPSTSAQAAEMDYTNSFINHSEPDPSKPGFYCRLCDSHSNSEGMWQNHILGKRHLANLKKTPGCAPSKSKYIPAAPNVRPYLFDLLNKQNTDNAPVVGLGQIREIRKPDIDGISYNCFLCNACISSFEIVDHILTRKHREKYLGSIKHPELETLKCFPMSDNSKDSIIAEICANVQQKVGTGFPEVYYAKNAVLRI